MAIPISYNLRNLWVRKTTTVMTTLGIALTVAVLLGILAMVGGLRAAFKTTGNPLHLMVFRKNSNSELVSQIGREAVSTLQLKNGIQKFPDGQPMVSAEIVTVINLTRPGNPEGANITIRGLSESGVKMRSEIGLVQGRWFQSGQREVSVGKALAKRYPDLALGKSIRFGHGDWTITGIFDAGKSAFESEIWADLNQIASDFNRNEVVSCVLARASDPVALKALKNAVSEDQRLNLEGKTEVEYYEEQTSSAAPVQFLGIFVAVIMAVGSSFAAMNTMYASVSRRSREIGTLRVLGFSRFHILVSFVLESLFLSLLGGLVGFFLVLPLNGLQAGIGNLVTFSETSFQFKITPAIAVVGILFASIMGVMGGFLPARSAARADVLNALREL